MGDHDVAVHEGRAAELAVELVLLAVSLHVFLENKFKLDCLKFNRTVDLHICVSFHFQYL